MADRPTVDEVAARLGVDPLDPELGDLVAAVTGMQDTDCRTDPYTHQLRVAFFLRCDNQYAQRARTFGTTESPDFGTSYVPRYDTRIDSLESDRRYHPVA